MRMFRQLVSIACVCAATGSPAAESSVSLDLNKLEQAEDGCRMHMVVTNHTATTFEKYLLDLVIFDADGVIAKRTALDVSPVQPNKTSVYAFSVKELGCDRFGRVLLNGVTGCDAAGSAPAGCAADVTLTSRAGVDLFK